MLLRVEHVMQKSLYAHCDDGGWILGYMIDGTQKRIHIPHADNSLYHIPESITDDAAVMLSFTNRL